MNDSELVAEVWAALLEHQIAVLGVSEATSAGGPLVVYLHGNMGYLNQEDAMAVLTSLKGVERVEPAPQTWTILRVYIGGGAEAR